jgi:HSP20 family protein
MPISDLIPWKKEKQVPVRREEEHPWSAFRGEMNRLFDDFFGGEREGSLVPLSGEWGAFSPQVDVSEAEDEIVVSAELPGLDQEDIDVSLSNGTLLIRGEKREEKEEKGESYYRSERAYGAFRRDIPLPSAVDAEQVDAVFKKGVLTITLPKTEEAKAKKVTLTTG